MILGFLLAGFGFLCVYLLLLHKNHRFGWRLLGQFLCLVPGSLICGIAWFLPVWKLTDADGDKWLASAQELGTRCIVAALAAGWLFRNPWLADVKRRQLLLSAAVHEIIGAAIFGTLIIPGIGTVFGAIYAFPLMPLQIIGSILQLTTYRHLARRFGLMDAETRPQ